MVERRESLSPPERRVSMTRIIIADDHPLAREGIKRIANSQPFLDVVGEAGNTDELFRALGESESDVLVLDISMPGSDFPDVLRRLRDTHPRVRILIMTMHDDLSYVVHSIRLGAGGFLTKGSAPSEVIEAITQVASGEQYICPMLTARLEGRGSGELLHETLSPRESQVLRLAASGLRASEIADRLSLSVKTVSTYRSRILQKLGLDSFPEAIRYAVEHDLVDRSP